MLDKIKQVEKYGNLILFFYTSSIFPNFQITVFLLLLMCVYVCTSAGAHIAQRFHILWTWNFKPLNLGAGSLPQVVCRGKMLNHLSNLHITLFLNNLFVISGCDINEDIWIIEKNLKYCCKMQLIIICITQCACH